MNFETQLFQYLENLKNNLRTQPMFLGGTSSWSGGLGGPPGGFIGYLPQGRVAYDFGEIASSGTPLSGMSLWDNLNHIRYRIQQLETGGVSPSGISSVLIIEQDGTVVASGVTLINFVGASVVEDIEGEVTVTITASGTTSFSGITVNEFPNITAITFSGATVSGIGDGEVLVSIDVPVPSSGVTFSSSKDFQDHLDGVLYPSNGVMTFIVDTNCTISGIYAYIGDYTIGTTVALDVNKNGTTLYINQINRPRLSDYAPLSITTPDILSLSAGDIITVDIDSSKGSASDLTVAVVVEWETPLGGSVLTVKEVDGSAIHDNVASEIHAITEKTSLVDNDEFLIEDSADSYKKKRVKKSNVLSGGTYWPAPTKPILSNFTWVNQETATATENGDGIWLLAPAVLGNKMRILKKSVPSTPYKITAMFLPFLHSQNFNVAGLCWRQSSDGKLATFNIAFDGSPKIETVKFNSPTEIDVRYIQIEFPIYSPLWLQIADDGTNRIAKWSIDGYNFIQFHSIERTDFITADEVGFYASSDNISWPAAIKLLSWKEE